MLLIKSGSTSQSLLVGPLLDSTSTTGAAKTGLTNSTSGLVASYCRPGADPVSITLASLAANNTAWTSGGFREINSTSQPGIYRLDIPDNALTAGASHVVLTIRGATGLVDWQERLVLVSLDLQDAVRAGLSALPNAASGAAGGLATLIGTPAQVSDVFTTTERNQIRHRLGIDGTSAAPSTGVPSLATAAAVAALGSPAQASTVGTPAQASAVSALGTPAQVSDVFTTTERNQIRHRLGIDGTSAAPSTGVPSLATAAAVAALGSPAQASTVGTPAQASTVGTPAQASELATLAARFSGITSLANWLRLGFRKNYTDATASGEIGGNYDASTDSLEAIRDQGDANWVTGTGGGAGGVTDWTATERQHIRHRLGIDGSAAAPSATPSLATAAAVAALGSPAQASTVGTPAQASTVGTPAQANELATLAARFSGITSLANWLRLGFRKTYTDATALTEIGGSYDAATDSLEAIRDRGDQSWITGTGGGGGGGGDPLASAVPGSYAPGTAGYRLGQIGTAAVNVTSPVAADGALTLVAGDDYSAADGRAIQIANPAGTWPDLTGASVALTAIRNGSTILAFSGAIVTPTGSQLVTFAPARESLPTPADAAEAWEYLYGVQATLASGRKVTLQTGRLTLIRGH